MKIKYRKMLRLIFILIIISSALLASYKVYKDNFAKNNETEVITDQNLSVNYLNGKYFNVDYLGSGESISKKISITNVSDSDIFLTISLMDVEKDSENLNIVVKDSNDVEVYNQKITNVDTELIKSVDLASKNTLSYTIEVSNLGEDSVYNFHANVLVYRENVKGDIKTFKDTILENNEVKDPITKVGEELATADEGLIKTEDEIGTAYYFRGKVVNNYVKLGDTLWRIVRINGDYSVRLVLDNVIDTQSPYNSDTSQTEKFEEKLRFEDSDINGVLDTWLNTNLTQFNKYIANTTFCEDTYVYQEEENKQYINPYRRIYVDNSPTINCSGEKITAKIGLLTADEVTLSGAYRDSANSEYYLYNEAIPGSYWTMSGSQVIKYNNVVDIIIVNKNGGMSYDKKISQSLYIRPVISLDQNTTVNGSGTLTDPYTIKDIDM